MGFVPLTTPLPSSLPQCLVAPGLEEAGVLGRSPALVSLKQTGGKEPAHPSPGLHLGARAGQEGGTAALGTQQGHSKTTTASPAILLGPIPIAGAAALACTPGGGGICTAAPMPLHKALLVHAPVSKSLTRSPMYIHFHDTTNPPEGFGGAAGSWVPDTNTPQQQQEPAPCRCLGTLHFANPSCL